MDMAVAMTASRRTALESLRSVWPERPMLVIGAEAVVHRLGVRHRDTGDIDIAASAEWADLHDLTTRLGYVRFAGEGESCWLSVSMMESKQPPTRGPDPSTVVGFEWAAGSVTVVDAKGRDLVRTPGDVRKDLALVQFSTHASGTPPPPGEPTIQYPVKVRLRVPAEWETVVRTFRFRGLQLPESEEPRETVPVGR